MCSPNNVLFKGTTAIFVESLFPRLPESKQQRRPVTHVEPAIPMEDLLLEDVIYNPPADNPN